MTDLPDSIFVEVPSEPVRKRVDPTFMLLVVAVVMNGCGLLAIWASNYFDSQRDSSEIVQIDCNNASRLSELEEGVSAILGIPRDAIEIRPCSEED